MTAFLYLIYSSPVLTWITIVCGIGAAIYLIRVLGTKNPEEQ